jgi:hypothetical protein
MKILNASLIAATSLAVTACASSGSYRTATEHVVVSSRIVQRAPAPRALQARTVVVHDHGRVDVSYPHWDARDPYQPWLSNYAPNLGEAGNNDGGSTGGDNSGGHSSSNGTSSF